MKKIKLALSIAALAVMAACTSGDGWTVKGTIEGGEGKVLKLEASHQGGWYALDSVELGANGKFAMSQSAIGYPDVYRLTIDGQSIYFPIDSIETVTVNASAGKFAEDYTLSGSDAAALMMDIDKKIAQMVSEKGADAVLCDSVLKRELSGVLVGDGASVVSYYLINKRIGGRQLFDPAKKYDLRMIGAVANAFATNRPNDPRTKYLQDLFLSNRRQNVNRQDTMHVVEVPIVDFTLPDADGKQVSMAELASHDKVLLLNFTIYDAEPSPAFNLELQKIYKENKGKGLEIVQVAVDPDQFAWTKSARNLPWVTLYGGGESGAKALLGYNVQDLPATFVINRRGEIVERVDDVSKLAGAVSKHL